eukprot:3426298-Rhodomonas_salina.3
METDGKGCVSQMSRLVAKVDPTASHSENTALGKAGRSVVANGLGPGRVIQNADGDGWVLGGGSQRSAMACSDDDSRTATEESPSLSEVATGCKEEQGAAANNVMHGQLKQENGGLENRGLEATGRHSRSRTAAGLREGEGGGEGGEQELRSQVTDVLEKAKAGTELCACECENGMADARLRG